MDNLRKDLELIEVEYKDSAAILTFLDIENGEVRDVKFNKQVFDNGKFIDSEEKAKKVEAWCQEFFNLSFDELNQAVGTKHDVYCYDNFNSMFEVDSVSKFTKDEVGEIFDTTIEDISHDNVAIKIRFKVNDKTYESKMTYAKYSDIRKEWYVDPIKKQKQETKFKDKFGVTIEDAESIIGKPIMVEVKLAMNKYPYAEIKKPKWNK